MAIRETEKRRAYFKWTPEAVERLRQLAHVKTAAWIGYEMGHNRHAVRTKMSALGIKGFQCAPGVVIPPPPAEMRGRSDAQIAADKTADEKAAQARQDKRIARMVALTDRIGKLRKWQGVAA